MNNNWWINELPRKMLTRLRLDLDAIAKDLLDAFNWIRAQISLVHTKTMNVMLTANPITVITKFIPEDIMLFNFCIHQKHKLFNFKPTHNSTSRILQFYYNQILISSAHYNKSAKKIEALEVRRVFLLIYTVSLERKGDCFIAGEKGRNTSKDRSYGRIRQRHGRKPT